MGLILPAAFENREYKNGVSRIGKVGTNSSGVVCWEVSALVERSRRYNQEAKILAVFAFC